MKKVFLKLTLVLAAVVLLTAMLMVAATATTYTGSCGTNVTYTLDTETGVLEISGTGAMTNYTSSSSAPWYSYRSYVKTVKIGDSVTSIGRYAFYNCSSLTSVTIPDSVTSIGYEAFYNCSSLESVVIGDSVTSIGEDAFYNTAYYNTESNWENGNVLYLGKHLIKAKELNTGSYAIKGGTLTIADYAFEYCGNLTSVVIPDSVTSIGSSAFSSCYSLTSVVIPDSVTSIGSWAFEDCYSLTSVTIPDSVTSIGWGAFKDCDSLKSINVADTNTMYCDIDGVLFTKDKKTLITYPAGGGATTYTFPDSVTSIGSSAFAYCRSLTSVVIPDSVTSIGSSAFAYCRSLTNVMFETKNATIGSYVFDGCYDLQTIYCYKDSTADALFSSSAYTKAYLNDGIISPESDFEYSVNSDGSSVTITEYVGGGGNVVIPSKIAGYDVSSIGMQAFNSCFGLKSVTIPDSVTSIGDDAFKDCSNLKNLYISDLESWLNVNLSNYSSHPLSTAGGNLYIDSVLATDIEIPDIATSIKYHFLNCENLTSVTIPSGITSIDDGCAYSVESWENDEYYSWPVYDYHFFGAFSGCSNLQSVIIGNSATRIGSFAFANCKSLIRVEIGGNVTCIGNGAFHNCQAITSITVPSSVISIEDGSFWEEEYYAGYVYQYYYVGAFSGCTKLNSVIIEDGVKGIGSYAFCDCRNLTIIEIPDSVTSIGEYAFYNTAYYNTASNWENGNVLYLGKHLIKAKKLNTGSYAIKAGTLTIAEGAFYDHDSLTSVEIPDSVTNIGNSAFRECSKLTSVVIPDSVTSIGDDAFEDCSSLKNLYISDLESWLNVSLSGYYSHPLSSAGGNLYIDGVLATDIKIPDTVTSIGNYAFYKCSSLKSVKIGDSVTSIGNYAFEDCSSLKSVKIPDSVTSIGNYAFYNCSSLTSVVIPDSVTSIGWGAFWGCSSLKNLYISDLESWLNVSLSNSSSHPLCSAGGNLYIDGVLATDIKIPDTVTSIGNYVFKNCSSLKSVEIPDSVTSIGDYAFYNCSSLTNVKIGDSVTSIGNYAFSNCDNLTTIYCYGNSKADRYFSSTDYTKIYLDGYIVKYDLNGGSGSFSEQFKPEGQTIYLDSNIPTKAGYDFKGWLGSNGKTYSAGGEYSENSNLVLTAIWEITTYTITYDANGGIGAPDTQTKAYGETIILSSEVPTKDNYTFRGWATSLGGGVAYTPGSRFTLNENTTLYAVWKADGYTISYNANGGTGAPASQLKTHDVSITLSATKPVRTGYTFQGWATTADGGVAYAPGASFALNADTTLYAVWKANTYTVTYNANGGIGVPMPQTKTHDVTLTLSLAVPTRVGYDFCGWAISLNSGVAYAPGADFDLEGNTDLYAVWKIKTYSVVYNANGGENAPESFIKDHFAKYTVSSVVPTRAGYRFCGWSTSADGEVEYMPGSTYSEDADLVLYAVWELYGDVDGNGKISSVDAVVLAQYLAGWGVKVNRATADCNGDGMLNALDAIMLAQKLAGWDVVLG